MGRTALIQQVVNHLLTTAPAPVPVLGPPGMGKTNLALAVACDPKVATRFGQRRLMVRCDAAHDRSALVAAMAEAMLLPLGIQQPEQLVLHTLSQGPTLLILDNFETPWEADILAVEEWLGMLSEIPGLCMLVTVRGAQRPTLTHWHETVEPKRLDVGTSIKLFNDLAGKDFASDRHLLPLLEAVDHVPLAITLLAPLAEGDPDLSGLWSRWQQERTRLLQRAGGRDRLTNLELSYELSWNGPRMTDLARQLLQRLAMLPAGVRHQDLQHLLPREVEASVSLLRKVGLAYDEADRLRLLAPLREAILQRHPLDQDAVRTLSGRWLKRITKQAGLVYRKGGSLALDQLAPEVANVEAMGLLCRDQDILSRLVKPWTNFQQASGRGSMALLDHVIGLASKAQNHQLCAISIHSKGQISYLRSQNSVARQCAEQALNLYKQCGDLSGQADCIRSQGELVRMQSDHDQASRLFDQALNLYQQIGGLQGQANCIRSKGDLAHSQSDHAVASQFFKQALNINQQTGNLLGQAQCIRSQGNLALMQSDHDQASRLFDQALNLYQQIGDLHGQANCIHSQGELAMIQSDYAVASQRFDQALNIYQQIDNLHGQAHCIRSQGDWARMQSDHAVASQCIDQALKMYQQTDDLQGQANSVRARGSLWLDRKKPEPALLDIQDALRLLTQSGDRHGQANARIEMGHAAAMQNDWAAAADAWQSVLNTVAEEIAPFEHGVAHVLMARTKPDHERQSHFQAAARAWRRIDTAVLRGKAPWCRVAPVELESVIAIAQAVTQTAA